MELIVDLVLLTASCAATFYCIILSRKLSKLKDTERGLGATIASMSQMVEQARLAVQDAKTTSNESVATLSPLVNETKEIIPRLSELIDVISELSEIAIADVRQAAETASQNVETRENALRSLINEARQERSRLMDEHRNSTRNPGIDERNDPMAEVSYIEDEVGDERAADRIRNTLKNAKRARDAKISIGAS